MSGNSEKYTPPESSEAAALAIHRWLFESQAGYAPRAEQLDGVLKVMRGSRSSARLAIWAGGGGLAIVGAYNTILAALAKAGGP